MKRIQAFGAGVQSVAMFRLILAGRIDRPDRIIFADTGAEPLEVYRVVERESTLAEAHGIPFDIVRWRNLANVNHKAVHTPLFTRTNGKLGMMMRTCTDRFKIQPIRRQIRALGWKHEGVEQYMGISTDEIQRVKASRVSYIVNRYPFIEMNWNRNDCVNYLASLGVVAAKSACVFCPFRSTANWQSVKAVPEDWAVAVMYDETVRNGKPGVSRYVHRSGLPLVDAVNDPVPSLFDDECEGYCGI